MAQGIYLAHDTERLLSTKDHLNVGTAGSVTLQEKNAVRVYENMILREIFQSEKKEKNDS